MGAGRPKELKEELVNANTKLEKSKKELIDALVATGPFRSKRELTDYWLELHEKERPEEFDKARQFIELTGGGK